MKKLRDTINQAHLTKTQTLIAQFVLDHASDACFMTSTEIANQIGVSEASVIRFSRSLGYTGFMDFQKDLRKNYQDQVYTISSAITVPSRRIANRKSYEHESDYINSHLKNVMKNLENVLINSQMSALEEAVDLIIHSQHKYITASRGNSSLGDYFLLYLKHMIPNVEAANSSAISPIDHMCHITDQDCLILFSFPRYSSVDELNAQMAQEAGAKIIVITDKPSAVLAKYATVLLTAPVDSNTFFNSMVAPQFLTESLLEMISHKVTGIEERLERIDKYLNQLGNY